MTLNQIIEGDCLEIMKTMPDNCIDLAISSPPYLNCRVYGNETLGRESDPREYVRNVVKYTVELKRILKSSGSFYLNIGDLYFGTKGFSRNKGKYKRKTDHHYKEHVIAKQDGKYLQHKQLLLLPTRVAALMQDDGWLLRNTIIWKKPNPLPAYSPDRRLPTYEYIFHFAKSKKYFFDYEIAKKYKHHIDVIECPVEPFGDHQASFPERLIEPLILSTSKENDVVFDPFSGSGTVCYLAKKNNRQYVGCEINPDYCKIAEKRIEDLQVSSSPDYYINEMLI